MVKFPEKIPDALARLLVVFVVLTGALAIAWVMIPTPMKNVHVQWDNAVQREKAKPVRYAGAHACEECHGEIYGKKRAGYHRDLSCETCHGPAKAHTEDPDKTKPTIPATRSFCVQCHAYNPSRPRGFPQINPQGHNPLKPCSACHNPHDPKPPQTPKECSACHGEIARTMAVSHHVQLACTVCHQAPPRHKVAPRSVKPTKPQDRDFCGKCHARDAKESKEKLAKNAPKVDMADHGEKYVCWQCHYPHSPEVEQ